MEKINCMDNIEIINEKINIALYESLIDEIVFGESIIDMENFRCIRFGTKEYDDIILNNQNKTTEI